MAQQYFTPYRRRSAYRPYRRSYGYRPNITKVPKNIVKQSISTTQSQTELYTAGDSNIVRTMTGLYLSGQVACSSAATISTIIGWALIKVEAGQPVPTINISDGAPMLPGNENLISSGIYVIGPNEDRPLEINLKSKRKLRIGDRLLLVFRATGSEATGEFTATSTLFLKD